MNRSHALICWTLCCIFAGAALIVYAGLSQAAGGGLLMPLDDAYIHFQYARQIAAGQPYVYNPGLPPTSGATSFLYPYLLALGSLLGFADQNLGFWALAIGFVALALSGWLIIRFASWCGAPWWAAGFVGLAFICAGGFTWHAASGMETLTMVLFTLWLLDALADRRFNQAIIAASFCALTRPEGAIAAGAAIIVLAADAVLSVHFTGEERRRGIAVRIGRALRENRRRFLWLLVPLLAIFVQPAINLLLTGSAVASGNAAKSLFGLIPFDAGVVLGRIADNFTRMWPEWLVPRDSLTVVGMAVGVMAVLGFVFLAAQRERRRVAVFCALTLIAGTLAVSTLDTAFWHFKRYQMPLVALIWALAAAGMVFAGQGFRLQRGWRFSTWVYAAACAALAATTVLSQAFLPAYSANVGYVAAQPYPMARWLAAHAAEDDVIAVHDVGAMRYFGGRTTLDIVGLTTPGAADYWRNGPGSVGEFLDARRPDLIASYGEGHGLGLGYLSATDLYAETLAEYPVELDNRINVALAAPLQGIYRPDYAAADRSLNLSALNQITSYLNGLSLVQTIDVADIDSERAAQYQWRNDEPPGGFPTEYFEFDTIGCADECAIMDGGRRINGEERFTISTVPGEDVVLVTRVHPAAAGVYDVYANDQHVGERVVPVLPGAWLEVPVLIPGALIASPQTTIRIVPRESGNYYMPYMHWVYSGDYSAGAPAQTPLSTFQEGRIALDDALVTREGDALSLRLAWAEPDVANAPTGDWSVFVHVLDQDGAIVLQADGRPGRGSLPPGNWLPGVFEDDLEFDISSLPQGDYEIVLGLYNPTSFERLIPTGGDAMNRGRLATLR